VGESIEADKLSRAPERLDALSKCIGAADSNILQHRFIKSQQGATLAVNRIAIAQPRKYSDARGVSARIAVNRMFQA
jgi:hypothetical protein